MTGHSSAKVRLAIAFGLFCPGGRAPRNPPRRPA